MKLDQALDILCKARNNLNHSDYQKIWGKDLGHHIWIQNGSHLLQIWRSGLTIDQKKSFIDYIKVKTW